MLALSDKATVELPMRKGLELLRGRGPPGTWILDTSDPNFNEKDLQRVGKLFGNTLQVFDVAAPGTSERFACGTVVGGTVGT